MAHLNGTIVLYSRELLLHLTLWSLSILFRLKELKFILAHIPRRWELVYLIQANHVDIARTQNVQVMLLQGITITIHKCFIKNIFKNNFPFSQIGLNNDSNYLC